MAVEAELYVLHPGPSRRLPESVRSLPDRHARPEPRNASLHALGRHVVDPPKLVGRLADEDGLLAPRQVAAVARVKLRHDYVPFGKRPCRRRERLAPPVEQVLRLLAASGTRREEVEGDRLGAQGDLRPDHLGEELALPDARPSHAHHRLYLLRGYFARSFQHGDLFSALYHPHGIYNRRGVADAGLRQLREDGHVFLVRDDAGLGGRWAYPEANEPYVAAAVPKLLHAIRDGLHACEGPRLSYPVVKGPVDREGRIVHVGWNGKDEGIALVREDRRGAHPLPVYLGQIADVAVPVAEEPVVPQHEEAVETVDPHQCPDGRPAPVPLRK